MRKSYDGLSALIKGTLKQDPLNGHIYVFVNRRRTQMKALYFDRSGYCIWGKRLERGQFQVRLGEGRVVEVNWTRLKLLVEGLSLSPLRQSIRYEHYEKKV